MTQRQSHFQGPVQAFLFLLLWGVHLAVWGWTWMTFYAHGIMRPFGWKGNWLVYGVYALLYLLFSRLYGGWRVGYFKRWDLVVSGMLTILFTNGITYLQVCLVGRAIMFFTPFVWLTLVQGAVLAVWAYSSAKIYTKVVQPRELLIVDGGTPQTEALKAKLATRPDRYLLKKTVIYNDTTDAIKGSLLGGNEAIVLCGLPARERNNLLKFCFECGISAYVTPKISDVLVRGAESVAIFDTPLLLNRNQGLSAGQRFTKRYLDLCVSAVALALLSPLMLTIALVIKASDGGPVFFWQERCTEGGRKFNICKFRSMVVDAGEAPVTDHDSRVTSVGRFLRATRLDELPQLFNVILGEMSLVGPRPETVSHVEAYTRDLPEFAYRSKVKAGLTGYAQIVGKYNTSARDKLLMDLMYIVNWSLLGDVKLILMTLKVLFFKESTAGFPTPQEAVAESPFKGDE